MPVNIACNTIKKHNNAESTIRTHQLESEPCVVIRLEIVPLINTPNIVPNGVPTPPLNSVFQKFQKYQMTLRENVMISNLDTERGDKTLLETLKKADVDMESQSYPDGLETMLSREFDGVDLSGGQWQRVSIARGINRDSKVIVLDEPTAAIDPIEETKIDRKSDV